MISNDLKFLVTVAWENRHGQVAVFASHGEGAAARRLVRRELLVEVGSMRFGLTNDGVRLLRQLDMVCQNGPNVAAIAKGALRVVK